MPSRALPIILTAWALVPLSVLYGVFAQTYHLFPSQQVSQATETLKTLTQSTLTALGLPQYPYIATEESRTVIVHRARAVAPGLTLISGLGPRGALFAKLVDIDGHLLHYWDLDWFRLWPNADYLPADVRPKSRPGAIIHGMVMESNGDLVFNFDNLGLMKVDFCDRPLWRLPLRTHHSVARDDAGDYWVSEVVRRTTPIAGLPNHVPPIQDFSAVEVSSDGHLMRKISIFDLLERNGYRGLLYTQSPDDNSNVVDGDMLHLNQVETFPNAMAEGLFKHGDVLISLRQINAIVVFDPRTLVIRAMIIGRTVRQHDAHFVDGWTVSALDNNNVDASRDPKKLSSRIITYSVKDRLTRVLFEGTPEHPFFTRTMGKQQRLENGDILITETLGGRALEVSPDSQVVWEYFNQTGRKGELGLLTQATRIPSEVLSVSKLQELSTQCPKA